MCVWCVCVCVRAHARVCVCARAHACMCACEDTGGTCDGVMSKPQIPGELETCTIVMISAGQVAKH